jgi:phosphoribosyl-ATP pyrophosphohydrolase/phosphoribosyl-AMP cyclohydrolase
MNQLDEIRFDAQGLVPVVIQDANTNAVLTLAYANREALELTMQKGETHLYSRSRKELWHKGATSGHIQRVVGIFFDCDADAIVYRVIPNGPACHTGAISCFSKEIPMSTESQPPTNTTSSSAGFAKAMLHLETVIADRRSASLDESYVAKLLAKGVDAIGKKIGEEATEVVIAAKNADRKEIIWEVADLLFHTTLMLEATGVTLDEVGTELLRRAK